MFAALSMISTAIRTMMKFRLMSTPSNPVINRTALTATYALNGTITSYPSRLSLVVNRLRRLRQYDCADDRAQQEDPDNLKLQEVIAEHFHSDRVGIAFLEHGRRRRIALCPSIGRLEQKSQD